MRLIDAGKLTEAVKEHFKACVDNGTALDPVDTNADICNLIRSAEPVDVRPLVRCKDCMYAKMEWSAKYEKDMLFCSRFMMPSNISFVSRFEDFGCTNGREIDNEAD